MTSWASALQQAKVLPHPNDRTSIIRELQKELKRVGCYDGEINAVWTPMIRKAIKDFTDWVNASLPADQPDNILLSLVQGHADPACGKSCPVGEGLSQDGRRCLPNAILAHAAKKASPMVAATEVRKTMPAPPLVTGWSTTTTTATAPVRPAVPPPEGRMALAGPDTQTSSPANTAPVADPSQARATNPQVRRDRVARHIPTSHHYRRPGTVSRSNFVRSILRQTSMN
jgi:hypothetical protein